MAGRSYVINAFLNLTYDAPEYYAEFTKTNGTGAKYYVTLDRENYVPVVDVPITLPAPFSLDTTLSYQISRSTNIDLTWQASSDGTLSYQYIWFCQDTAQTSWYSDPVSITDNGAISLAQPAELPAANCNLTLVFDRDLLTSEPAGGSESFGLGHSTHGIQRRSINFYSTSP